MANEDEFAAQQQQLEQKILALENLVKAFLSKEAISRYSNIKIAHPDKALQVLSIVGQLIQKGKIKEKLSDEEFKNILLQLSEPKRQTKISF